MRARFSSATSCRSIHIYSRSSHVGIPYDTFIHGRLYHIVPAAPDQLIRRKRSRHISSSSPDDLMVCGRSGLLLFLSLFPPLFLPTPPSLLPR